MAYAHKVRANAKRVLEELHHLRSFGAAKPPHSVTSARGGDGQLKGVVRPALSAEDVVAREWFSDRMEEAGLISTGLDKIGTVLGRGTVETGAPRLLVGSHSDTQPEGGWLDGALGVIYGLEAARAIQEAGGPNAIDVINFQDEEGRFGTLTGSTAWATGSLDLHAVSKIPLVAGPAITLEQAIRNNHLEDRPLMQLEEDHPYIGFFEAHIEQGRRLELAKQSVAVVNTIVGCRQFRVEFNGETNHAGTTQMADRCDAASAAFDFVHEVRTAFTDLRSETSVWTVGKFEISPGAASIVPGQASLVLQFRDPSEERLDDMEAIVRQCHAKVSASSPVQVEMMFDRKNILGQAMDPLLQVTTKQARPPIPSTKLILKISMEKDFTIGYLHNMHATRPEKLTSFYTFAQGHIAAAAEDCLGAEGWQTMHSGAVHDAGMVGKRMPSSMMFVPSINGISHNFAEDTDEEDIVNGAHVFAQAAARMVQHAHGIA
eukprot:CAMPEP_0182565574 /NCGR_PEP_ID=MMETSP1324-20130603/7253_1 /TAXON_ID=236786 /ORGANISM="Florenciella sp., Strain RCC1587" /LENGTH=487 /DNA_ID=CAMNT_0024779249 /DNA_START=5 /DNA_END=1469 /DNA_ORIENTATION=-